MLVLIKLNCNVHTRIVSLKKEWDSLYKFIKWVNAFVN